MTFRQKVIGDCCDGLTGSPDIYIVTQGGIQSRKNTASSRWMAATGVLYIVHD